MPDDGNTWTAPGGAVFRLRPGALPPYAIFELARTVPQPEVPVVRVHVAGNEVDEENPLDPDYLDAVDEADGKRKRLMEDTFLATGCEVVSVPDGVPGFDDVDWEWFAEAGVELPCCAAIPLNADGVKVRTCDHTDKRRQRQVWWMRHYLLGDDFLTQYNLMSAIVGGAKLTQEEAAAVAESFPAGTGRRAVDAPGDVEPRADRDQHARAAADVLDPPA